MNQTGIKNELQEKQDFLFQEMRMNERSVPMNSDSGSS